jgi:hypothetical protein
MNLSEEIAGAKERAKTLSLKGMAKGDIAARINAEFAVCAYVTSKGLFASVAKGEGKEEIVRL